MRNHFDPPKTWPERLSDFVADLTMPTLMLLALIFLGFVVYRATSWLIAGGVAS